MQIDAAAHSVQILDEQKGDAVVQQYSAPAQGSVEINAGKNDHLTVEIASLPAMAAAPNLNWIELANAPGSSRLRRLNATRWSWTFPMIQNANSW